jgi:hypothetical protein
MQSGRVIEELFRTSGSDVVGTFIVLEWQSGIMSGVFGTRLVFFPEVVTMRESFRADFVTLVHPGTSIAEITSGERSTSSSASAHMVPSCLEKRKPQFWKYVLLVILHFNKAQFTASCNHRSLISSAFVLQSPPHLPPRSHPSHRTQQQT